MLSEDKIKLMTELSLYEKKEHDAIFGINSFFKKDYVIKRLLESFVSYTFCYGLLLLIELLYSADGIINTVDVMLVIGVFYGYIIRYFVGLVVFELITLTVVLSVFNRALRKKKVYQGKLKKLQKRYEFQAKSRELGGYR